MNSPVAPSNFCRQRRNVLLYIPNTFMKLMKKQLGLIGEFLISSQDLSQDLETVCPKLPNGIFWGIPIFKEDHTIL